MTSSNGNISALLAICAGNSPVPRWIPSTKASDAEPWCKNREAGDLRRYRAHYDVTVMICSLMAYLEMHTLHVWIELQKNFRLGSHIVIQNSDVHS